MIAGVGYNDVGWLVTYSRYSVFFLDIVKRL